jgi:CheY-like chemotaxis protein
MPQMTNTTVLVADDNADIRRLFRAALNQVFDVRECEDGDSVIPLMRRIQPKMVFLDIMMPGELNGLQVLSAIRETEELRHTIVVMVSARDQEQDRNNAELHGADGYITKPFSPQAVVEAASRWMF